MRWSLLLPILLVGALGATSAPAQIDEDQLGAWYMYFFGTRIGESRWGFQGDGQFRNWDLGGDLEQLLLRGGVTYTPKSTDVLITLGYANITTGKFGPSDETSREDRIYQEVLLPQKIGPRVYLRHRFRYEQRWVENQSFRTRLRYNLFVDLPLNRQRVEKGAFYLAFYNEIFINGERDIGNGLEVDYFDRNRFYGALGYGMSKTSKVQLGYMQQTTDGISKGQLQLSLHHSF